MYCRAKIYILYVISQLLDRWIDAASFFREGAVDISEDFMKWNFEEWLSYINIHFDGNILVQELIAKIQKKYPHSKNKLVESLLMHCQSITNSNGRIILFTDPQYPELLKVIKDPPLAVNVLGDLSVLNYPKVSLVGSRNACRRALSESFELGVSLANNGIAVVSGGAFGCDISVHQGVVSTGLVPCPAIVVFAGGLESFYPTGNLPIFNMMLKHGAVLISERLNWHKARPFDFPIRNRIVSGLSRETILMQADKKSGAMITARLALDQGRDVSVLDFIENDEVAAGNVELIADGAIGFSSAKDWFDGALDEFHFYY